MLGALRLLANCCFEIKGLFVRAHLASGVSEESETLTYSCFQTEPMALFSLTFLTLCRTIPCSNGIHFAGNYLCSLLIRLTVRYTG